jgi:hypothetical protein
MLFSRAPTPPRLLQVGEYQERSSQYTISTNIQALKMMWKRSKKKGPKINILIYREKGFSDIYRKSCMHVYVQDVFKEGLFAEILFRLPARSFH